MSEDETIDFWVNQSLEIFIPTKGAFFTQIVNLDTDLLIQRPVNSESVPLTIDKDMTITVYFHHGMKGLYSFESKLQQLNKNKFSLKRPVKNVIEKAQRRRFFRIQVALDMHLLVSPSNDENKVERLTALTYDISGGGVAFLSHSKVVQKDSIVKGTIVLDKDKQVDFTGKVVHLIQQPNKIYRNSIEFINMSESVRTEIIQFCMYKQIELRKKVNENS